MLPPYLNEHMSMQIVSKLSVLIYSFKILYTFLLSGYFIDMKYDSFTFEPHPLT